MTPAAPAQTAAPNEGDVVGLPGQSLVEENKRVVSQGGGFLAR